MGREKYLADSNVIIKLATENNLRVDSKAFLTTIDWVLIFQLLQKLRC